MGKHQVAVQVLKHKKFRDSYCGNKRRTFKQVQSETSNINSSNTDSPNTNNYQIELTKLLRQNGLLNKQPKSHFKFHEDDNMSEVSFFQRGQAKSLEDSAKQVYSQICGWTLVHSGLSDPVAIARRRQVQDIEKEKKMFIAKHFLELNQGRQIEAEKKRTKMAERFFKLAEPLNKQQVEPGFENSDNWGD